MNNYTHGKIYKNYRQAKNTKQKVKNNNYFYKHKKGR